MNGDGTRNPRELGFVFPDQMRGQAIGVLYEDPVIISHRASLALRRVELGLDRCRRSV